ncbi:hypothetical protein SAMN04489860_1048 [Paraoerskovia marina]|uniref:Uncharacterized protein n=1 Tax=Paraoerskovia marina TaxID=545619 RepID=A0A1H1QCP5_9CELL|nr:hypothetical protein [Paraoerskovia marina]SDS21205.1 hypothetical protein SAMN04489860_1048 [Paraoerskovia marina]
MSAWPPIDRDDLRAAAATAGFDTTFPLLVRRLIAETGKGLTRIDMPGGSGTAVGGFDGVVTASEETAFVPAGTSVWELSVGGGQRKANEDYEKRLVGPGEVSASDATYIEVLLDTWSKSRSWSVEKSAERRWRKVEGYNLDRIDAWLEQAPATTVWLAEQVGKVTDGVRSLTTWWDRAWLPSTVPHLDAQLVLSGREASARQLLDRLQTGLSWTRLDGDLRADEFRAFVASALQNESADADHILARSVVVTDAATLARLAALNEPLIFVLDDPAIARDVATSERHQFVVAVPRGGESDIEVPRVTSSEVHARLEQAGLHGDAAAKLKTLARRSLLALRRAIAVHPETLTPRWATSPDAIRRRTLLLGSWNGGTEGDQKVVARLLGAPYEQVEEQLLGLLEGEDIPFLARVDSVWFVLAIEDAWALLGRSLSPSDLQSVSDAVLDVLSEPDPVLALDTDKRWTAGIRGIRRRYSSTIRRGLAETLAIAAATNMLLGPQEESGELWARSIVRTLFASANADESYSQWSSLSDVLSLLAEAAPGEFLEAMRVGLDGESKLHSAMFRDADSGPFGFGNSSPHTAVLWALEIVAWSPDHLNDAVEVLAALADLDPGGKLSNRPSASLLGILSAWNPNTAAGIELRLRAMERIVAKHPQLCTRLLLGLIPDTHETQIAHPGPRFRGWKIPQQVTRGQLVETVGRAADLVLENLTDNAHDYIEVLGKIDRMSPAHRSLFVKKMIEFAGRQDGEAQTTEVWNALRDKISNHREYEDAGWALSTEELAALDEACTVLAPMDPVARSAWLFDSDWVTLGDFKRRDDFSAYEAEVARRRTTAIHEVQTNGGIDAVERLATKVDAPYFVGSALANEPPELDRELLGWISDEAGSRRAVAEGYFVRRLSGGDLELRNELIDQTPDPRGKARILLYARQPEQAWSALTELGAEVEAIYWSEFNYFGLGKHFAGVEEASRNLIAAGRAAAALDMIGLYSHPEESDKAVAELVASGLEALLEESQGEESFGHLDNYHFQRLFAILANCREDLGEARVVGLEFQYFPALGFDADAPSLHRAMLEDPSFFVELVTLAYREDDKSGSSDRTAEGDGSERQRSIAIRAYEVLHSLRQCPGGSPEGDLDGEVLGEWIRDAREQLVAVGRSRVGEHQLGQVLAQAPAGTGGSAIHPVVLQIVEDLHSDAVERGVEVGFYNKRGISTRSILEGGTQEWEAAEVLRRQAVQVGASPRARNMLNRLADSYESSARREDRSAERRHQGLDW